MRKNSIKNTRINAEVQRELSTLISREIKDPRINPMTSVVHAEVAPDLKTAKVYISVLGDEDSKKSTLAGLRSAASFMRGQLAKSLNLRNTPELTFVIDNSIEYGVHMSKLIDDVNRDLFKKDPADLDEDDTEDSDEEDPEDSDEESEEDTHGSRLTDDSERKLFKENPEDSDEEGPDTSDEEARREGTHKSRLFDDSERKLFKEAPVYSDKEEDDEDLDDHDDEDLDEEHHNHRK